MADGFLPDFQKAIPNRTLPCMGQRQPTHVVHSVASIRLLYK